MCVINRIFCKHYLFKDAALTAKRLKMSTRYSSDYEAFREVLNKSNNITVVTGAGISAEAGIPTFRGSGGFWRTYNATDLATPSAFKANPSLVWEFYHYRRELVFGCAPTKAHTALAKYEQLCEKNGRKLTVITQNIDGLHQKAGSQNVIELHGALNKVWCTKCKEIYVNNDSPICEALKGRGAPDVNNQALPPVAVKDLPRCKHCGGLLRPYVIWFGENLDGETLMKAGARADDCDLCVLVGTSSNVYPAAMFAPMIAQRGVPVAEFNITEAPFDSTFHFYFQGLCGTTLPKALGLEAEVEQSK